ncbi:MAG: hypothetical protein WKF66_19665 [Pedobacter sp.]
MPQADAGRYCDRCEKTIVDLTTKSDAELLQFFKRKDDKICGRLLDSQLNRQLVPPLPKLSWHWLMPLAVSSVIVSPAAAQNLRPVLAPIGQTPAAIPKSASLPVEPTVSRDTISGRVVDNLNGKPLTGVHVRQKGFENVLAITDSTGRFELAITMENIAVPYSFQLIGYSKVEATLNSNMIVKLTTATNIRLGGISTFSANEGPLIIVHAGKKSCTIDNAKFKDLPQDWIEKIEVLKDATATVIYGSKAVNGVILIGIKKSSAKYFDFSSKKKND